MKLHRLMALLAVLALAVFTGTAAAGGGHGNGGGDKSGGYSGQQQNQSTSAPSDHQSKQSDTSASQPATGGDNSHGVKPSNTTKHDTHAAASSDQTKQYGNGQTAGQIATQAGYGDATLHGPGNSQPHKTAACPGGHEVDVHALKNKDSNCSSSQETKQVASAKVDVEKSKKTDVDVAKAKSDEENSESAEVETSENDVTKTEVKKVDVDKAKSDEENSESADVEKSEHDVTAGDIQGVAVSAHEHVTICHATGSSSNPYVRISPSASGVFHGHLGHQDGRDIVPPFTWKGQTFSENWDANGIAIYNAGCTVAAAGAAPAASAATLAPAASATVTPTAAAPAAVAAAAPATASAPAASAPAAAAPAVAAPAAAGGVKGAVVALKPTKTKPAGGVLGATTRLGGSVASTRLPFTGLPLWIFALVAAGLIGIGLTMRRASMNRV
jgi:hypothetical protein